MSLLKGQRNIRLDVGFSREQRSVPEQRAASSHHCLTSAAGEILHPAGDRYEQPRRDHVGTDVYETSHRDYETFESFNQAGFWSDLWLEEHTGAFVRHSLSLRPWRQP